MRSGRFANFWIFLGLIICLTSGPRAEAESITLVDGTLIENVTVTKVEPHQLTVMTDAGIKKIPFDKLPKEVQEKHGYDPAKAAKYQEDQAAKAQAARNQIAQELAAQKKDTPGQEKPPIPQETTGQNVLTVEGKIILNDPQGVLVDCGDGRSPNDPGVPGPPPARGIVHLVGHPDQRNLALDTVIKVVASPKGMYQYLAISGATETVKSFVVISPNSSP